MSFRRIHYRESDILFVPTDTCNCRPASPLRWKLREKSLRTRGLTIRTKIERLGDKVLKCLTGLHARCWQQCLTRVMTRSRVFENKVLARDFRQFGVSHVMHVILTSHLDIYRDATSMDICRTDVCLLKRRKSFLCFATGYFTFLAASILDIYLTEIFVIRIQLGETFYDATTYISLENSCEYKYFNIRFHRNLCSRNRSFKTINL